jgi:hypothetical protein
VAAATDQSKLPKDDGGQSPRKVVGRDGPDQSNDNNRRLQMGGGMTLTASQLQKAMHVSSSRTGMMIKSDQDVMQKRLQ